MTGGATSPDQVRFRTPDELIGPGAVPLREGSALHVIHRESGYSTAQTAPRRCRVQPSPVGPPVANDSTSGRRLACSICTSRLRRAWSRRAR